nr:MAG TPA: hypothetical protein [Caudoviricetes sp.]
MERMIKKYNYSLSQVLHLFNYAGKQSKRKDFL